jgi:Zn-dependent peptidase ImmA (M78 family)
LFDARALPSFICRSSQGKEPEERQADTYASCLLMPRKLVLAAWEELFMDGKRRVLQPEESIDHPFVELPRLRGGFGTQAWVETDDDVLERVAKPLAQLFLVSPIAMRIRLEKLGLLLREVPQQQILACCW